jgi:predicted Zn finger-like uncharacterized protein
MIIRCAHCQGTMRIDEKSLPDRPKVKVRCPHCNGIGYVEPKVPRPTPTVSSPAERPTPKSPQSKFPLPQQVADEPGMEYDLSIPEDAFEEFRFPAEQNGNGRLRNGIRNGATVGLKTIILVIASLITVAFFALLVNIILPGPGGVKGAVPSVQSEEEQTSAKNSRDILQGIDSRPAPLREPDRQHR